MWSTSVSVYVRCVMSSSGLTCRSCLAASAPARVWNVTNPTGCNDTHTEKFATDKYTYDIFHKRGTLDVRLDWVWVEERALGKIWFWCFVPKAHPCCDRSWDKGMSAFGEGIHTHRCGFAIFAGDLKQRTLVALERCKKEI